MAAAGFLPKPPKPSFFANRRERDFYKFMSEHFEGENVPADKVVIDNALEFANRYPKIKETYLAIACLAGARNGDNFPALVETCKEVWSNRKLAFGCYEARKYFPLLSMKIQITPGIWFNESFGISAFGFLYAEVLQDAAKEVMHYQQQLMNVLKSGNQELAQIAEEMIQASKSDLIHFVNDATNNAPVGSEAYVSIFKTSFNNALQNFELVRAAMADSFASFEKSVESVSNLSAAKAPSKKK